MNEINDNIFINMKFGVNAQKHNNNPIDEAPKETPNSNNSKKEQEPQNNIRLEEYLNGLEYYGAPNHASPKPIIPNNNDKESPSVGINVSGNSTEGAISNEESLRLINKFFGSTDNVSIIRTSLDDDNRTRIAYVVHNSNGTSSDYIMYVNKEENEVSLIKYYIDFDTKKVVFTQTDTTYSDNNEYSTTYYNENGIMYKNESGTAQSNLTTYYNENGEILKEEYYTNGRISIVTLHNDDGTKTRTFYKDENNYRTTISDEERNIIKSEVCKNGETTVEFVAEWYEAGFKSADDYNQATSLGYTKDEYYEAKERGLQDLSAETYHKMIENGQIDMPKLTMETETISTEDGSRKITYEYDEFGRKNPASEIRYDKNGNEIGRSEYITDDNGNIVEVYHYYVDNNGNTYKLKTDSNGDTSVVMITDKNGKDITQSKLNEIENRNTNNNSKNTDSESFNPDKYKNSDGTWNIDAMVKDGWGKSFTGNSAQYLFELLKQLYSGNSGNNVNKRGGNSDSGNYYTGEDRYNSHAGDAWGMVGGEDHGYGLNINDWNDGGGIGYDYGQPTPDKGEVHDYKK